MKPAAIYARVSSERQKVEHTILSQVAALTEHARDEGYTVPEEWIFQDEGYSGAMLVRPGLERLRDLVTEGQIETLLIYSPDRLSRKYAYQVLLVEEFSRHGVDVVFLKSAKATTPEEELMLQFQGMIAEYERAQITERTRRGKKHRAKAGSVNVLSGAPFGFRYVKKTEISSACYEVIEKEAEIVRKVFWLYLEDGLSINAIARWLNDKEIPTRRGISRWERSTVWGMLRNPAYRGTACFGKTERAERQKLTRPLRMKGGFSPRCSCSRERPRAQWVEIGVPAIINEAIFAQAQERLELNKRFSPRRTIEATLLQGMLVCGECGHAFYRTSTRTSKRKLYYYRCLGSDDYRYPTGRVCSNRPVRQDYLDEIVWRRVLQLLEDPELIRAEIERRLQEIQHSNPTRQKKEVLTKQIARSNKSIEKLLDAYQEDLLHLEELRNRMPELRRREKALRTELQSLDAAAYDQQTFLRLAGNIEHFLGCLRETADTMDVKERQKIVRLVVKEVLVEQETIKIKHSIPVKERNNPPPKPSADPQVPSYLLRSGSHHPSLGSAGFGPGDLLAPFFVYLRDLTPKPQTNQAQHRSIRYASFDHSHEPIMGNGVKIARKVRVIDILSPGLEAFPDLVHGSVSIALRSEAMGAVHEVCLKDGFNHQQHGHLHYPVPYTGDTQGAQFAVGFGDVYASHGQWAISAASKLLLNLSEESAYSLATLNILDSYPIHSRCASIGSHPVPGRFQYIRAIDPVIESVEPVTRFLLGLATQLPSQKGDVHKHIGFRFKPFCYPFRYGAFLAQAASPCLDRNTTEVRPLGSTGITPLPCYYGPLRLPTTADVRVIDSSHSLSSSLTASGLPGSSTDLSTRALLNHPERLGWSFCSFLPNRWQVSSSPGDWPPPFTCNEAESGSLTLGLASSLSRQDLYLSPNGSHPLTGLLPAFGYPTREAAATC